MNIINDSNRREQDDGSMSSNPNLLQEFVTLTWIEHKICEHEDFFDGNNTALVIERSGLRLRPF